jgi:hypothetical protein
MDANRPRPVRQRDRLQQDTTNRVCADPSCDTKLSRYNAGDLCAIHSEGVERGTTRALPRHTRLKSD